jgi:hypothetical protein
MDGQSKEGWEKCQAPGCPKWFDPKTRPGPAVTCCTECSEEYDRAYRKNRWEGEIGEAQNALSRERHKPIITVLPLGTVVREKWSRLPNMVPCAFPDCTVVFDSKKGATFCPEHRDQREQVYQQNYQADHKAELKIYHHDRHAEKKANTPLVMMTCQNPACPFGEDGQPKQWVRRIGKNDYCCKECRMAVWTPANREKRDASRRFTPDHRAKIAAGVKAARQAATEAGISFGRKRKLTDDQQSKIIERRRAGEALVAIAKDYAVSKATISRITTIKT